MTSRKKAYAIRKHIAHIEGAWVRVWADGEIGAGATWRSNRDKVKQALEAAGYRCEMRGTPGTSGEDVITVLEPE